MKHIKDFSLFSAYLDNHTDINQRLLAGLTQYIDDKTTRKSHDFNGRYENIYISQKLIPELSLILETVNNYAADILNCSSSDLKAGLWFNVMNPGDSTTLHKHDDDDELLSAVYYVSVADNSGTLILDKPPVQSQVTPEEGLFVFFPPNMPHEVTENMSDKCRVSLGINIGPANSESPL